jgi:lipopolysaccharide/colanic/teichoic acid biosynthesis glycosyltransferase
MLNVLQALPWYNRRAVLFALDAAAAVFVCWIAYLLHPDETTFSTIVVWWMTLVVFWRNASDASRYFIHSHRHAVRLLLSTLCVSLIYFLVLRAPYSLVSLCVVSVGWLFCAGLTRGLFIYYRPAQRLLGAPAVLEQLRVDRKWVKIPTRDPDQVDYESFDGVVFDPLAEYNASWQRFFIRATWVGIPVFSLAELTEWLDGQVSTAFLKAVWVEQGFVLHRSYGYFKHSVDWLIALMISPLLCVLGVLIALVIRWSMGSPVLYGQPRVGLGGKIFTLYKFRTMILDAEKQGETQIGDPRITPFGHFLRRFRLDELPQVWNILRGEMSWVGPRPEWQHTAEQFAAQIPLYDLRHIVRPGITGWAQVHQGHTTGIDGNAQKLQYDIFYVKYCSIWLDLKIILKTIHIVFMGYGAV